MVMFGQMTLFENIIVSLLSVSISIFEILSFLGTYYLVGTIVFCDQGLFKLVPNAEAFLRLTGTRRSYVPSPRMLLVNMKVIIIKSVSGQQRPCESCYLLSGNSKRTLLSGAKLNKLVTDEDSIVIATVWNVGYSTGGSLILQVASLELQVSGVISKPAKSNQGASAVSFISTIRSWTFKTPFF